LVSTFSLFWSTTFEGELTDSCPEEVVLEVVEVEESCLILSSVVEVSKTREREKRERKSQSLLLYYSNE
jgi:hypothetical protein